ncbi:MAG: hypothetical protein ACFCVK_02975 [Acidimicrobiales bacterium]
MFRPIVEPPAACRRRLTPTRSGAYVALAAGAAVLASVGALPVTAGAQSATGPEEAEVAILGVDLVAGGVARTQVAPADGTTDWSHEPVDLVSIMVDHGGPTALRPLGTAIDVRNVTVPGDVVGMAVSENGVATATSDAAFEVAAERAYNSPDLRDYVRSDNLNRPGDTWGADYDVVFSTPLAAGQYLLVQERAGNAPFRLTPLGADGTPVAGAPTLTIGPPYGWNTGYAPADYPDPQPVHLTALDVADLVPDGGGTIAGLRVDNDGEADIKLVPMGRSGVAASEPFEAAAVAAGPSTVEGLGFAKTVYRGHDGGAGCATAATYAEATQFEQVTYCFTVTNTGTAALADITFVDPFVAGDPVLMSADSTPLAPGHRAVYVLEGAPPLDEADGAVDDTYTNVASVTAQPVDGNGDPAGGPLTATAEAVVYPGEEIPVPEVELSVSVYAGHDGGVGCPAAEVTTVEEGAPITYCFVVTNVGNTHLDSIALTDPIVGFVDDAGVAGVPVLIHAGSTPLAPGASASYQLETASPAVPDGGLFTTAAVTANAVDQGGADLTGLPDVFDNDSAQILKPGTAAASSVTAETPVAPAAGPAAPLASISAPTQLAFTGWGTGILVIFGALLVGGGGWLLVATADARAETAVVPARTARPRSGQDERSTR